MEIARQVQARLFPQVLPRTGTFECAATCVPALHVGGDYDVVELDQHRLGIVIGDVAGKGIPAALLMANVQAGLRSGSSRALHDVSGLLQSVNRSFFVNSLDASYTTLFYGVYDDETGRLTM